MPARKRMSMSQKSGQPQINRAFFGKPVVLEACKECCEERQVLTKYPLTRFESFLQLFSITDPEVRVAVMKLVNGLLSERPDLTKLQEMTHDESIPFTEDQEKDLNQSLNHRLVLRNELWRSGLNEWHLTVQQDLRDSESNQKLHGSGISASPSTQSVQFGQTQRSILVGDEDWKNQLKHQLEKFEEEKQEDLISVKI